MWQVSPAEQSAAVEQTWCSPLPQLAAQTVPVFDPQQIMPGHPAFVVHVTPTKPPSAVPLLEPLELLPLLLPLVLLPLELPLDEPLLLPTPPLELPLPALSLPPLLQPKSAAATTDTTPTARPMFMTMLLASPEVLELSRLIP
jgi:hypothetical protein